MDPTTRKVILCQIFVSCVKGPQQVRFKRIAGPAPECLILDMSLNTFLTRKETIATVIFMILSRRF